MYQTEQITDNSYQDIQSLYLLSFGLAYSLDYVSQKYDTEKFGLKNIGMLAKSEENDLAGYYGVFPSRMSYKGVDYLVAQSGDTMTAPDHRKKGLFTKLAKETYALSKSQGIKLVFGFPNENSYPGFKHKLEWEFHGFMQRFSFDVKTIPFCEISSKWTKLKPLYKRFVKNRIAKYQIEMDQIDFDSFNFSKVNGNIKKDKDFFSYKLKKENVFVVLIDGFQLLINTDTHLYVGEVAKIEENQTDQLLDSVKKLARKLGCKKAIFTLSENHWLFPLLDKNNTPSESLPIGFYMIDQTIDPQEIQFSNADYDTF